jgi:hypothetical protein
LTARINGESWKMIGRENGKALFNKTISIRISKKYFKKEKCGVLFKFKIK